MQESTNLASAKPTHLTDEAQLTEAAPAFQSGAQFSGLLWLPRPDERTLLALIINDFDAAPVAFQTLEARAFTNDAARRIFGACHAVWGDANTYPLLNPASLASYCVDRALECEQQAEESDNGQETQRLTLESNLWGEARDIVEVELATLPTGTRDAKKEAEGIAKRLNEARLLAPPEADEWREPLPLKNALLPVLALPEVLIPSPLRAWVFDCAERISVAPDYIAVAALVALASLVGNTVCIRPKRRDDWRVVPNLWGALVGSPSVKKSPAIAEALGPLSRLKALELDQHQLALKEWEADALLNELDADALKSELKKKQKAGASRDELKAFIEASGADGSAKPTLKTYSVQDATIEALTNVLARNPRGFLIERDELTGWLRSLEKQGHEQDRAFFLEAFNGTAKHQQVERVGRGTVIVPHFTLSILGTIQPLPFAQLIRAASSGAGADGFVSRFQLLVYPDAPEYRHVDRWPDASAKSRAFAIFEALDKLTPEVAGAQCDEGETRFLRFSDDGQKVFDEWIIGLEKRLPQMGTLMEQHLAKYRSLMPSLALLFHLIALADGSEEAGGVNERAAMMAVEWCDFLESHARRIYAMATDGATDGAELIAQRFGQLPNPFTLREVHQKRWTGLSEREDVESALARLEERGWIRSQPDASSIGRPTLRFWKHPAKAQEK